MERIITIRTEKIVSHKENGEPIIEQSKVKLIDTVEYLNLENNNPFINFVKLINTNKYKSTPVVLSVIEEKERKELDIEQYQDFIFEQSKKLEEKKPINYKEISERQAIEIEKLKAEFEERLKKLETKNTRAKKQQKEEN